MLVLTVRELLNGAEATHLIGVFDNEEKAIEAALDYETKWDTEHFEFFVQDVVMNTACTSVPRSIDPWEV